MLALMCFLWLLSISEAITRYGFWAAPANLSTCSPSATRKSILKIMLLILALKNEKEKIRDLDQKLAQSKENVEGLYCRTLLLLSMMTLITGFTCPPTICFKFITKCDKCYYKVWQLFYYKVRWSAITKCDSFFIIKCDKCYYKVRQVLQSATTITNCDRTRIENKNSSLIKLPLYMKVISCCKIVNILILRGRLSVSSSYGL